jgi:hypothetical protein
MDPTPHNPDGPAHRNELGEVLRLAVDAVRAERLPEEQMKQVMDDVRRMGPLPEPKRHWRRWAGLSVAGATAVALLTYGLQGLPWRQMSEPPGQTIEPNEVLEQSAVKANNLFDVNVDGVSGVPAPAAELGTTLQPFGLPLYSTNPPDRGFFLDGGYVMWRQPNQLRDHLVAVRGFTLTDSGSPNSRAATAISAPSQGSEGRSNRSPTVWQSDRSRPTVARVSVGGRNSLDLVSLHVHVLVEGARARTVVDHVFHNSHDRRLEGTLEYPLPAGASPCYYALFPGKSQEKMPPLFAQRGQAPSPPSDVLARVAPADLARQVDATDWGKLQEARVVSKDKALETYEDVVRRRVDPALLEYAGGNTFVGRVFPIPAKGFTRVLLAYEELLPVIDERLVYRFPLPDHKLGEVRFTLSADAKECRDPSIRLDGTARTVAGGRVTFARSWKDVAPEGEVIFSCKPTDVRVQSVSGRQGDNGPCYLYTRVRPEVPTFEKGTAFACHAAFLLDTSQSEHPDRFAVSMKLLRKILESDPDLRFFNVLTFNVGAAWLDPGGWVPNTAEGRDKALARLDGLVLEGATDLSCALDKLCRPSFNIDPGMAVNAFLLSDGHLTWGEDNPASLVARLEKRCPFRVHFHYYRTGLGEENAELFESLTRSGGGVFACYGAADLAAAASAHRRECLKIERIHFVGGLAASDVLVDGRRGAVYPGGEFVVAARFAQPGPTTLVLEGTFRGKKVVQEFPLEIRDGGELAPRAWAEVAVASLLALHDDSLDHLVTAYCQQFGVASRVASFLVLENEADYKRLNLESERGKTFSGDLGDFLEQAWAGLGRDLSPRTELDRLLHRLDRRVPDLKGKAGEQINKLLALLREEDVVLPRADLPGTLLYERNAAAEYLADRGKDRRQVGVYFSEARRRAEAGDVAGAVRVLSGIVEEHPGRGDALRLVGYRLLDLRQPAHAARLFQRVQSQRPFEGHSYRDLARALEAAGRPALAALNYDILLAGTWHPRFGDALHQVAREEYAALLRESLRCNTGNKGLAEFFRARLDELSGADTPDDLRVTISWNTDSTDIDLWVIEPDGTKVFYSNPRSKSGGELSKDQTQGYGPERYRISHAPPGSFKVLVHYFGTNPNLLGGETHVQVSVTRHAGTARETTQRQTVVLREHNQQVEVCTVRFGSP